MISAHGIGGAKDLPIPLGHAVVGGGVAVAVSFVVLLVAWRAPRYDAATSGRPAPAWLQRTVAAAAYAWVWRVFGLVVFAYAAFAAVFGKDELANPVFGIFYVWWWVWLVPLSLLLGPVWRWISPVRTLHLLLARAAGIDAEEGVFRYPARLGCWPACLGLLAFTWIELVSGHGTELGAVRLWCAIYVGAMLVGGVLFGRVFFRCVDPFEVYSSLVAHLSVWGRREGELVVRSPLANLDSLPVVPGTVAVLSVLFGSTAFDSFKDSEAWLSFFQTNHFIASHTWGPTLADNLALVGFCLVVGLVFAAGTMLTGVGPGQRRRDLPALFAHSIVPIVVGYVLAHYLTYLVEQGQETLIQASDPLSTGANYLGTGHLTVNLWLSFHPTFLAEVKVAAVVLGHVVGVVAAHDRALRLLPEKHRITGQLPLVLAMVAFTVAGLYLLFAA